MTKRRDPEADVVQFFLHANESTVYTVFRIVRGIVAQRGLLRAPNAGPLPARRTRSKNTPAAVAAPVVDEYVRPV